MMALVPLLAHGQQPLSPLVKSFDEHLKLKQESVFGLEWIPLGPTTNSALVESFQVDIQHPGTIFLGFGSGSLWKTTNNGLTWRPVFENQPSYGIGDVALAPSNTRIMYLGTGETLKKPRNFTMPGTGMYRSDDGGVHRPCHRLAPRFGDPIACDRKIRIFGELDEERPCVDSEVGAAKPREQPGLDLALEPRGLDPEADRLGNRRQERRNSAVPRGDDEGCHRA